jgi:DNA-binding transcriptional ArsR family regulator
LNISPVFRTLGHSVISSHERLVAGESIYQVRSWPEQLQSAATIGFIRIKRKRTTMTDDPPDESESADSIMGESTTSERTHTNTSKAAILDLDEVFAALGHPRRRYLLYTLVNEGSEETLSELATKLAAWEQDKPASEVTDDERRDVQLSLYHSHIPKLADFGVLDYQEAGDIIVRARNTEQVQAILAGAGAELDARQESHARQTDADDEK